MEYTQKHFKTNPEPVMKTTDVILTRWFLRLN